jgi:hypothetical protein
MDAISFYAGQERSPIRATADILVARVSKDPNDRLRKNLHETLTRWDWEDNASWAASTDPNSKARRQRIYDLLRIKGNLRAALERYIPAYEGAKSVFVDDPMAVRGWFTSDFRSEHNFYWEKLRTYLQNVRKFNVEVVNSIESSADRILERLANPAAEEIFAARGLVVGYVQSGKTTNFTAVIAKAIDAGYRLIIVLSGTTNLLRNQTQRRLDMDLVGRENIQKGAKEGEAEHDYVEDVGWPDRFITHGGRPSLLGSIDVHRLTTQEDFVSTDGGFNPLEFNFEKMDRHKPLFDLQNLQHAGARIAVIKKQSTRLKALIKELKAVGPDMCKEIPALVIDDESDQASVNTVSPRKSHDKKAESLRSSINEHIVEILQRLPRAQYIGYTATPFANVFINPRDPKDLYPRHFIVSLDRPQSYMGAREFIDFARPHRGRLSNRDAHIREVPKLDGKIRDDRLQEAMDAFVLTGAIKKFRHDRAGNGVDDFRHHTMLYHQSVRTVDQKQVKADLLKMWSKAGYDSPGPALKRLKILFESDFRRVWEDRGRHSRFPTRFDELLPFVGQALDEIRKDGDPVLMVNSADGADVPDFDSKAGVWKIVVGGAKLSRGYTIQGLTISYFRRQSKMQDTLMQMGRWFGYRSGYEDLVRLYIGVAEKVGTKTVNLYEAFRAMCRDEEDFREQLARYAGKDGITPREVPALVFNSFPALRPTSRNKMFNAKVTWAEFEYREPTGQAFNKNGLLHNEREFRKMLEDTQIHDDHVRAVAGYDFNIKWAPISKYKLVSALQNISWEKTGGRIEAEISYLKKKDLPIDSWVIVAPQLKSDDVRPWTAEGHNFACVARSRVGARFGVFSTPEHLEFAKWLVGPDSDAFSSELKQSCRTGVLLFYPTWERRDKKVVFGVAPAMGFGIVLPQSKDPSAKRLAWVVNSH